jgi:IS30 family transposase
MHRRYQPLSRVERGKIMYLKTWGLTVSQIALELGRDKGTISRELRRNRQLLIEYYLDESAQARADRRRKQASQGYRLKNRRIRSYVEGKLQGGWSPEIVAGRIKLDLPGCSVSHEGIEGHFPYYSSSLRGRPAFFGPRARPRRDSKMARKAALPNGRPVAVIRRISAASSSGSPLR